MGGKEYQKMSVLSVQTNLHIETKLSHAFVLQSKYTKIQQIVPRNVSSLVFVMTGFL